LTLRRKAENMRTKPAVQKRSTPVVFGEFATQFAELRLLVSPSLPVPVCIIKKENCGTGFCEM